jgi:predicted ATP-dependent endonuclease of OLD family
MKLKAFQVTEFQSVLDSNPIQVGDVTCLVGKNESGKTALLQALYRSNPIRAQDGAYSVTDDYPRAEVIDYEDAVKRGSRRPAKVVEAQFKLSPSETSAVSERLGPDFLATNTVRLQKCYPDTTTYWLDVNESAAIKFLTRNLSEELRTSTQAARTASELVTALQPAASDPAAAAILPLLQETGTNSFGWYAWNRILSPLAPKFLYFDEYYQMRGCDNIEALQQRVSSNALLPSDQPLLGLIELARLNLEELLNPQRTQELKNRLEAAGNHLTGRILKYWSQNKHLQMRFDVRPARPGDPEGMQQGTNIGPRSTIRAISSRPAWVRVRAALCGSSPS